MPFNCSDFSTLDLLRAMWGGVRHGRLTLIALTVVEHGAGVGLSGGVRVLGRAGAFCCGVEPERQLREGESRRGESGILIEEVPDSLFRRTCGAGHKPRRP